MTELATVVITAAVVGLPCYLLGRMVGEERGRVDAYRRIAEAVRRREREGRR